MVRAACGRSAGQGRSAFCRPARPARSPPLGSPPRCGHQLATRRAVEPLHQCNLRCIQVTQRRPTTAVKRRIWASATASAASHICQPERRAPGAAPWGRRGREMRGGRTWKWKPSRCVGRGGVVEGRARRQARDEQGADATCQAAENAERRERELLPVRKKIFGLGF